VVIQGSLAAFAGNAVVGANDDKGVVAVTELVDGVQEPADMRVKKVDAGLEIPDFI
jgi:hypothetical protein